jgi:hypothetical protein
MTRARTLADMISDGVIGTTELADDVITPVKLDETGNYTMAQLGLSGTAPVLNYTDTDNSITAQIGSGTSDFNIATTTSHNIDIRTNNTRRMVVESDGDISFYDTSGNAKFFWDASAESLGIGTTSPSNALTINQGGATDYIRLEGPSSGDIAGGLQLYRGSTLRAAFYANPTHDLTILSEVGINFRTNNGNRMAITSLGSVGIGTANDYVGGVTGNGSLNVLHSTAGQWVMQGRADVAGANGLFIRAGDSSSDTTALFTGRNEADVHMKIDGEGNVGIGSGSLDALEARSSFNYKSLRVQNFNINAGDSNYGFIGQNLYQDTAGQTKYIDSGYSSSIHFWGDQMQFHMGTGSADAAQSNTEKMRMLSNGNIQQFKQMHFGYTYYTNNGYIDTDFTAADGMVFEIAGSVNPNSGGSSYSDVFHGHIYIGKGWNGSALTHYVYFVLDTPPARDIYPSGSSASGNDIDVVIHNNGVETTNVSQADSSNWNIRLKASNYNTGSGANFYLNITRKL